MLGLVVLLAVLVPAGPLALDRSLSEAMRDLETPLLTDLALVFNWLGRGIGRALELTIIGLLLLRRRRRLALAAFAAAETVAPLLSTLLKSLVDRPRPPAGLVHALGASFPSGHATYAGATCVALVLLFTTPGARRRWWWLLAGLGIVGMAWSRTYPQVHWLTDVIAGALLGSGISLLIFAIAQTHVGETPSRQASTRAGHLDAPDEVGALPPAASPLLREGREHDRTRNCDPQLLDSSPAKLSPAVRVVKFRLERARLRKRPSGIRLPVESLARLLAAGSIVRLGPVFSHCKRTE